MFAFGCKMSVCLSGLKVEMLSPGSPVPRSPAKKDKPVRQRGARRPVGKLNAQSNPFLAADAAAQEEGNPPNETKRAWEHPKENHASLAAAVPKRVRLSAEKSLLGESQNIENRQSINVTPSGVTAAELRELEAERLAAEAAVKADFAARRTAEGVHLGAEFAARRAAEEAAVSAATNAGPGPASLAQQRLQPDGGGALLAAEEMRRWLQRGAPAAGSACRGSAASPAAAAGAHSKARRQPETISEFKVALP